MVNYSSKYLIRCNCERISRPLLLNAAGKFGLEIIVREKIIKLDYVMIVMYCNQFLIDKRRELRSLYTMLPFIAAKITQANATWCSHYIEKEEVQPNYVAAGRSFVDLQRSHSDDLRKKKWWFLCSVSVSVSRGGINKLWCNWIILFILYSVSGAQSPITYLDQREIERIYGRIDAECTNFPSRLCGRWKLTYILGSEANRRQFTTSNQNWNLNCFSQPVYPVVNYTCKK